MMIQGEDPVISLETRKDVQFFKDLCFSLAAGGATIYFNGQDHDSEFRQFVGLTFLSAAINKYVLAMKIFMREIPYKSINQAGQTYVIDRTRKLLRPIAMVGVGTACISAKLFSATIGLSTAPSLISLALEGFVTYKLSGYFR